MSRLLILARFSDVFTDVSSLLPSAAYERDPTVDYRVHQAVLYTMATCHSLRSIDGEILGDPLDVKMFEFTGWTFEEFAQQLGSENEEELNHPSCIARPPPGSEYDPNDTEPSEVSKISEVEILTNQCSIMYPLS